MRNGFNIKNLIGLSLKWHMVKTIRESDARELVNEIINKRCIDKRSASYYKELQRDIQCYSSTLFFINPGIRNF